MIARVVALSRHEDEHIRVEDSRLLLEDLRHIRVLLVEEVGIDHLHGPPLLSVEEVPKVLEIGFLGGRELMGRRHLDAVGGDAVGGDAVAVDAVAVEVIGDDQTTAATDNGVDDKLTGEVAEVVEVVGEFD